MLATLSIENSRKKRNLYWIPYILEHESLGQRHFSNRSSYLVYNAIKFTIVVQKKKRFARCRTLIGARMTSWYFPLYHANIADTSICTYVHLVSYRNSKYNIRINKLMYLCRNPQIVTFECSIKLVIIIYAYSQWHVVAYSKQINRN